MSTDNNCKDNSIQKQIIFLFMVKGNSFLNFHLDTYFCFRHIGKINTGLSGLKSLHWDIILWETRKGTEPGSVLISPYPC